MAKRKSAAVVDEGALVDRMFSDFSASLKSEWGGSVYVNGDEESRVICLAVPLALQFLLQQEGFTLGRFTMLVGLPESCKSAFGYELCRIHRQAGGGFSLVETEKKDSPTLMRSIVGYDPGRYTATYVKTAEEWQRFDRESMELLKPTMDKRLKPPRSIPWLWLVDSLAGVTTERLAEKCNDEGAATLVQPQLACILNQFFKVMPHWVEDYPFSIVGINHLKLQKDQHGHNSIRQIQGGYAPRFAESLEIEMVRMDRKQIDRRMRCREQGVRLGMTVAKNSTAARGPQVIVEMLWYFEEVELPTGELAEVQRTYFDWPSAAIELLIKPPLDAASCREVDAIVDLHPSSKDRTVWSDALGIPESDPLSYREAGIILEGRRDIVEALYKPLGIRRRNMFQTGVSFKEQQEKAARRAYRLTGDGMTRGRDNGNTTPVELPVDPQRARE